MIERHHQHTGSAIAAQVLSDWDGMVSRFVKVMPTDYKRVLSALLRAYASGLSGDEAEMEAFEANKDMLAEVGGG